MTQSPKVIFLPDESGASPRASQGVTVVILGQAPDGPSLNVDGALMILSSIEDINLRLGRNTAVHIAHEICAEFFDRARTPFYFGRITGTGGVKAQTPVINDLAGTPVATLRASWAGQSTNGNRYSLKVSRGRLSTTDTGAGRKDTKLELIETLTNKVIQVLEGTMDVSSRAYLVNAWNNLKTVCNLADQTPNDTYENTDEPLVGTYAFTGGVDPIAMTSTEIQAAVDNLDTAQNLNKALVGVWGWTAAEVNYLANKAEAHRWHIIDQLEETVTPASAKTHADGITTSRKSVSTYRGWGLRVENSLADPVATQIDKRTPGLPVVLAQAVRGARNGNGRAYNQVGAGEIVDGWVSFDGVTPGDKELYAQARVNPLYFEEFEGQKGVVIGDVLTLADDGRYNQFPAKRVDDLIFSDIEAYLNNRVKLKDGYLWGTTKEADLSVSTAAQIDADIVRLFVQYPNTLLSGGRGVGWEWQFHDLINGTDGPEPVFKLGTAPAQIGRIFTVLVGRVEGRFGVIQNPDQATLQVGA